MRFALQKWPTVLTDTSLSSRPPRICWPGVVCNFSWQTIPQRTNVLAGTSRLTVYLRQAPSLIEMERRYGMGGGLSLPTLQQYIRLGVDDLFPRVGHVPLQMLCSRQVFFGLRALRLAKAGWQPSSATAGQNWQIQVFISSQVSDALSAECKFNPGDACRLEAWQHFDDIEQGAKDQLDVLIAWIKLSDFATLLCVKCRGRNQDLWFWKRNGRIGASENSVPTLGWSHHRYWRLFFEMCASVYLVYQGFFPRRMLSDSFMES